MHLIRDLDRVLLADALDGQQHCALAVEAGLLVALGEPLQVFPQWGEFIEEKYYAGGQPEDPGPVVLVIGSFFDEASGEGAKLVAWFARSDRHHYYPIIRQMFAGVTSSAGARMPVDFPG